MIVFPDCKINLGLNIISKRTDGYHNLETVFYPLPFYDVLEVIRNADQNQSTEIIISGLQVEGNQENNLCLKAYYLLKNDFPQLPSLKVYLHKTIPSGAGLGGGSADGAFMLMLLNNKFNLKIEQQQLLQYALQLGSDCAFFIINKPCFATQRGEVLEQINLDLSAYKIVLVNPDIHLKTSQAFSQVSLYKSKELKTAIMQPVNSWKENVVNDFELPVFKLFPEIETIKNKLYNEGAVYACMSGSGSTVFGIFNKDFLIRTNAFPEHYFIKEFLI